MKNIFIVLSLILTLYLLSSCEKELNFDLPKENPKITVNALFSNLSYWKMRLSSNASVNKQSNTFVDNAIDTLLFDYIENAEVLIYEDNILLTKLYYIGKGTYIDSLLYPKAGKSYTLKVSAPGYPSITATEKLPDKLIYNSKKIGVDSTTNEGYFNFSIQKPNEKSYYFSQIHFKQTKYFKADSTIFYDSWQKYEQLTFPYLAKDYIYYQDFNLFSDDNFPNTENIEFQANYNQNIPIYETEEALKCVNLGRCSPNFYQFIKDFNNYTTESQFFDEPTGIYSNIDGGYGIFAGVTITTDTLYYYKRQ